MFLAFTSNYGTLQNAFCSDQEGSTDHWSGYIILLTVPRRVSPAFRLRLCSPFPPSAVCISTLGIFALSSASAQSTYSKAITDAPACGVFLASEEDQSPDGQGRGREHTKAGPDHHFLCLDISWKFSGGWRLQNTRRTTGFTQWYNTSFQISYEWVRSLFGICVITDCLNYQSSVIPWNGIFLYPQVKYKSS